MRRLLALTSVCLLTSITGCAKTEYIVVTETRFVDLPERFLLDCAITEWVDGGSFRDLAKLAAARGVDLAVCNAQLREAREFQREEAEKRN